MKTILDEFERRTIEAWSQDRIEHIPAWCYGELFTVACTKRPDGSTWWQIGCIPRGSFFPNKSLGVYKTIEDACKAMKELAKINNCWAMVNEFTPELHKKLRDVCARCNGDNNIVTLIGGTNVPKHALPNMNGADAANYQ